MGVPARDHPPGPSALPGHSAGGRRRALHRVARVLLRDCPELNLIVKGEGEHTFYEVLEVYGSGGDYHQVAGICYLDANGGFQDNGGLPRIRDVGSIPWPYWPDGYLEKFWAAGKSYGVRTERDMPILGSRGCPYRCTFCSSPQMWTTRAT